MKTRFLLVAGFALGLGAAGTQAMAQEQAVAGDPVDGTVNIDASVAPKCLFTGDNPVQLSLGELANAVGNLDTSKVNDKSVTLHAWCNSAGSQMHVEATKLALTPALVPNPTGFVQQVDYTASALANAKTATDDTLINGPGGDVTVGIFTGDVLVKLSDPLATGLLLAGAYQGTVVVTLTPG